MVDGYRTKSVGLGSAFVTHDGSCTEVVGKRESAPVARVIAGGFIRGPFHHERWKEIRGLLGRLTVHSRNIAGSIDTDMNRRFHCR